MSAPAPDLDGAIERLAAVVNSRGELGAQKPDIVAVCAALHDLRQASDVTRAAANVAEVGAYRATLEELRHARERLVDYGRVVRRVRAEHIAALAKLAQLRTYAEALLDHNGQTWDALHGRQLLALLSGTGPSVEELSERQTTWRKRAEAAERKLDAVRAILDSADAFGDELDPDDIRKALA